MATTRREFLTRAGGVGFLTWLGADLARSSVTVGEARRRDPATARGILRLRLKATRLDEMAAFYGDTIGWPVVYRVGRSLTVGAGGTEILFEPASEGISPYYHVAWAIPSNLFVEGKAWLAARTPLLKHPDGRDEFHFDNVERRAVYFADPAGNILELIARDHLGDRADGAFGLEHLLYVNHAGLVVEEMDATVAALGSSLGLRPTYPPSPTFATLGDAHRHVVLVPRGRIWIPEMRRAAEVFPVGVTLHGARAEELDFATLPYRVALAPS